MTFTPSADLAEFTDYIVTVSSNATDLVGHTLDGNMNGTEEGSPTDDFVFNFTTAYTTPEIPLEKGWNLISVPYEQTSTLVEDVLISIEGNYDIVQYYDASDPIDPWKTFVVGKPPQWNDLTDIDHTMGFYVNVTRTGVSLSVSGVPPSSPTPIHLYPGWNMVGYPSTTDRLRDDALNNLNYGSEIASMKYYDTSTGKLVEVGPTDYIQMGQGYWVYATGHYDWFVIP
jgi:hypothetical protein